MKASFLRFVTSGSCGLLVLAFAAPQAAAIPTPSEVAIDGSFSYVTGGVPAFAGFSDVRVSANPNNAGLFDQSLLPFGTPVVVTPFNFADGSNPPAGTATFSFTDSFGTTYVIQLDEIVSGIPASGFAPGSLFFSGNSTLSYSGTEESFTDNFLFTINSAESTTFSATFYFPPPAVPDGGSTLLLLGGGLAGLGFWRRILARI
jgi:hypothetical protein